MPQTATEIATAYAAMGRSIMPTGAPGKDNKHKAPYLESWKGLQSKRAELVQLIQWQNKYHNSLWGMITGTISGCFVIDIDDPEAYKVMGDLKPHVKTKRGWHWYFKHPGGKIITKAGLLPHVDIRGDGGFVNFAGANEGASYETLIMPTDENLYKFEQLPQAVQEALTKPKGHASLAERLLADAIAKAGAGTRNETGLWLACQLRDNNIPRADCEVVMRSYTTAVTSKGTEPYLESEAMGSLDQAFTREPREAWPEGSSAIVGGNGKYIIKGDNGPVLNFNLLVADLLAEYRFATYFDIGEVLVYQGGVYTRRGKALIEAECQKRVGISKLIGRKVIDEILGHIQRSTFVDRSDFNSSKDTINIQNGLLNIKTHILSPHTPDFRSTIQFPLTYDSNADCPVIKKFLSEVMTKDDIYTMQEFAGYCLHPGYPIQKAFLLQGDGDNGKSTYINLVQAVVGKQNCAHVSWQSLEYNRFASSTLEGKLLNAFADLPATEITLTTTFKTLTGGDDVESEVKFQGKKSFVNSAKLIFSTNKPPIVKKEDSFAFWRRWILIDFPFQIPADKKDPKLIEKMTTAAELSGFLNYALDGLARILNKGEFTYKKSVAETTKIYQKNANPILAFTDDILAAAPNDTIDKNDVYDLYRIYCLRNKLPISLPNTFAKGFANQENLHVNSIRLAVKDAAGNEKRVYAWKGVYVQGVEALEELEKFRKGELKLEPTPTPKPQVGKASELSKESMQNPLINSHGAENASIVKDNIENGVYSIDKGKNLVSADSPTKDVQISKTPPDVTLDTKEDNDSTDSLDVATKKFITDKAYFVSQKLEMEVVRAHELWEKAGSPELTIGNVVTTDFADSLIYEDFTDEVYEKLKKWLKRQEG
jgi:putative DNA primase/helicase